MHTGVKCLVLSHLNIINISNVNIYLFAFLGLDKDKIRQET